MQHTHAYSRSVWYCRILSWISDFFGSSGVLPSSLCREKLVLEVPVHVRSSRWPRAPKLTQVMPPSVCAGFLKVEWNIFQIHSVKQDAKQQKKGIKGARHSGAVVCNRSNDVHWLRTSEPRPFRENIKVIFKGKWYTRPHFHVCVQTTW